VERGPQRTHRDRGEVFVAEFVSPQAAFAADLQQLGIPVSSGFNSETWKSRDPAGRVIACIPHAYTVVSLAAWIPYLGSSVAARLETWLAVRGLPDLRVAQDST
jgi:hypothetical protein